MNKVAQQILIRVLSYKDLDKIYPHVRDRINSCGAQSESSFICTLDPGHDGPHIAHGYEVVDAWLDESQGE